MRKLSKKISMLMVLAMLVSLFSGVVSASAASAWSFYNKTADVVVERNGNYEMENNEFADFDLFKDGKTIDTDTYAVKYESSDADVVFVDAKNGKLRAKGEAGEKATFTAVITNKNTKVVARRSFNISIVDAAEYAIVADFADEVFAVGEKYALAATVTADGKEVDATVAFALDGAAITEFAPAEAGEYTIVATATVDGEVVATEKFVVVATESVTEIVAKQTALNAVEITADAKWVAAAAANKELVNVVQVIDNVDVAELVKNVEAKKDAENVLVVTLYNNLATDATYKFEYDGAEDSVVGAGTTPASIQVVSKNVPANTLGQAEIKVFNAAGIDVTTDDLKYAAKFTADENTFCDVQEDGGLYFFEVGKTIVVKAEFDMGWDTEGNELTDLTAVGEYTSVEPVVYSKPNGYALNDANNAKEEKDLTYSNSLKVSLSDEEFFLVAKYEEAPFEADVKTDYIVAGADDHSDAVYTYKSTNESVLLVEEATGEFKPCKEGYASVYIKKGDTVVGSVSVKVDGARKLNTFTASISDKKLSTAFADSTKIAVKANDQFGVAYPAVTYSMVLDTVKVNNAEVELGDFFDIADATDLEVNDDGEIALPLSDAAAAALADNKVQSIAFTIKATDTVNDNNEKTQRLSVSIKDNAGYTGEVSRKLNVSASKMDIALDNKKLDEYVVTIQLDKTDSDGYELGLEDIAFQASATTGNPYSVVITKVGDNDFNATESEFFALAGGKITVTTVKDATSKLATGTYKIQLFTDKGDKMQPSTPQYLTIEDTTPAVTAVVTTTNIEDDIADVLEFYINGAKIESGNITAVAIKDYVDTADGSKVYVKTVTVSLKTKALNGDSELELVFDKDVTVNQLFTVE